MFGQQRWGDLNALAVTHDIVGETVHCKEPRFSFIGGHRVQLWHFKKNVHWKIPAGVTLDITDVQPAGQAPRKQGRR